MQFDLKVENLSEAQDTLALVRGVLSPRATLRGATTLLLTNIKERFLKQVSPDGTPWEPSLLALNEGRSTLFMSGDLFNNIYAKYKSDLEWDISYNKDNTTPYGAFFQSGRGQTQREFIGVADEDISEIVAYLDRRIADVLKRGYNHRE